MLQSAANRGRGDTEAPEGGKPATADKEGNKVGNEQADVDTMTMHQDAGDDIAPVQTPRTTSSQQTTPRRSRLDMEVDNLVFESAGALAWQTPTGRRNRRKVNYQE